jgi:5-methylcytosine-specific restriction enzyme A
MKWGSKMPKRPPHPCAKQRCPNLTYGRFCEEHVTEENRRYQKYDRGYDSKKRYGRAWKRIRDKYVETHPFCEKCYAKGILVPTEEVHHRVPLAEGGTHEKSNLISLCKSCHAQIHAARGDRWHKKNHVYEYGPEINRPRRG